MADLNLLDFYKDCALVLMSLHRAFPRKTDLFVEDLIGPDEVDEFGLHTKRLAEAGLVGLGFTNAPASIAPSGGAKPVVGTNPFSLAVPGETGPALLIDQSASTIAKSEVMKHAREGKPIPVGWALDADGNPTTDPNVGLKGSMAPSGVDLVFMPSREVGEYWPLVRP